MKKIVLLCNAGLSTSMLVSKLQIEARKQGFDASIMAYPVSEAARAANDADLVLLGPQVKFMLSKVIDSVACPVAVIDMAAYGMMAADKVMKQIHQILQDE